MDRAPVQAKATPEERAWVAEARCQEAELMFCFSLRCLHGQSSKRGGIWGQGHFSAHPSINRVSQPFTRHLDQLFPWLCWLSRAECQWAPRPPDQRAFTTSRQRTRLFSYLCGDHWFSGNSPRLYGSVLWVAGESAFCHEFLTWELLLVFPHS